MRFKRGLAGLASVGAVVLVGALAPSAAMAHPCISEVEASMGTSLTLHTGGNWAGAMPSFADLEHECADDIDSYLYDSQSETSAVGEPVGPVVASFAIKNLTPLGYSQRSVPFTGDGLGRLQLRPGLQGQPGHRRNLRGLPHPRLHRQDEPDPARQLHGLQRRPG